MTIDEIIAEVRNSARRIPRSLQIETVITGVLLLFALAGGWAMKVMTQANAERDLEVARRLQAKLQLVLDELNRKPEKTKDETLAEQCALIATERVQSQSGGKDLSEFYLWRNSIRQRYEGFENFVANFEYAVAPLPDCAKRVVETAAKREELYGRYCQARRAARAASGQLTIRDEFETEAEHKARLNHGEQAKKALEVKRDEALDAIVDFELTCSPELIRSSVNGFYGLDEALVFVPNTVWTYEADEHRFCVEGMNLKEAHKELMGSDEKETIQSFNFSVSGIRVSQFVKSRTINFKYSLDDGAWKHPRQFKDYKQKHPFLLVRLGQCDFKVQGTTNRVMTMPWRHLEVKNDASVPGRYIGGVDDNRYLHSIVHGKFEPVWRDAEAEALKTDTSLVLTYTYDGYNSQHALQATETFADYETPQGREKIERVLRHFEGIGGLYYREFCKSVRLAMER